MSDIMGSRIWTSPPSAARRMALSWDLKYVGTIQAQTDPSPAQKRVRLGRRIDGVQELVPSQVESPYDDRSRRHLSHDATVRRQLLLLGRQLVSEEQKLGSVHADPLGTIVDSSLDFAGQVDVGHQVDLDAVEGHGRQISAGQQVALAAQVAPHLRPIVTEGPFIRAHVDDTAVAIDDDEITRVDRPRAIGRADDGWQPQGSGDDTGVSRGAAGVRHQSLHKAAPEQNRLRRQQISGDDDGIRAHRIEALQLTAGEARKNLMLDVHNVGDAGFEVFVLDVGEGVLEARHGHGQSPFGSALGLANAGDRLVLDLRVFEHGELRVEDLGEIGTVFHLHHAPGAANLIAYCAHGVQEPLDFRLHSGGGDPTCRHGRGFDVMDKSGADADASGGGYASQLLS